MLHHGIHVRPGFSEQSNWIGRKIAVIDFALESALAYDDYCMFLQYVETIEQAMNEAEESDKHLIFLHSGTYNNPESILIDTNIQIIGAGMQNFQCLNSACYLTRKYRIGKKYV